METQGPNKWPFKTLNANKVNSVLLGIQWNLLLFSLSLVTQFFTISDDFIISLSSYLGGEANDDSIRGVIIQQDGTIVIGGSISKIEWGNLSPTLLGEATSTSPGVVLRLNPDGKTILSVTKVGNRVVDLANDEKGNLYVAAWDAGLLKLDASGSNLLWQKKFDDRYVWRVDASPSGYVVILTHPITQTDPDKSDPGVGRIYLYNSNGEELSSFNGHRNTLDVCIDEISRTIIHIGWRQASYNGVPVQIAYIRGCELNGAIRYTAYDWPTSGTPNLNTPENNMADTRGYRCTIGKDGKLYCAFECAGGNHMFRYDPFDITKKVSIVGGDSYHEFYNTKSEHKTFFARYEPQTGVYLKGQQFVCRLSNGAGNAVRPRAITADVHGYVYLGGTSAYGLPLTFNPFGPEEYTGGAWLLIMNPDFNYRVYCTRLATNGTTFAIAVSSSSHLVIAGQTNTTTTFLMNPLQTIPSTFSEGLISVLKDSSGVSGAPQAIIQASPVTGNAPLVVSFSGTNSFDNEGEIVSYHWDLGDGNVSTDPSFIHTYTENGNYFVTLTVTDNDGFSSSATVLIQVGNSTSNTGNLTGNPDPNPLQRAGDYSAGRCGISGPLQGHDLGLLWSFSLIFFLFLRKKKGSKK